MHGYRLEGEENRPDFGREVAVFPFSHTFQRSFLFNFEEWFFCAVAGCCFLFLPPLRFGNVVTARCLWAPVDERHGCFSGVILFAFSLRSMTSIESLFPKTFLMVTASNNNCFSIWAIGVYKFSNCHHMLPFPAPLCPNIPKRDFSPQFPGRVQFLHWKNFPNSVTQTKSTEALSKMAYYISQDEVNRKNDSWVPHRNFDVAKYLRILLLDPFQMVKTWPTFTSKNSGWGRTSISSWLMNHQRFWTKPRCFRTRLLEYHEAPDKPRFIRQSREIS